MRLFPAGLVLYAIATLIASLLAWVFPLYSISAPDAGIFVLGVTGWVGDSLPAFAFGTIPGQNYASLFWFAILSLLVTIIILISGAKLATGKDGAVSEREQTLWFALAVAGWLTPLGVVIFLIMDDFPQPTLILQETGGAGTAIATWEPILWVQIGVAAVTLVGALFSLSPGAGASHPTSSVTVPPEVPGLLHLDAMRIHQELSQANVLGKKSQSRSRSPRAKASVRA